MICTRPLSMFARFTCACCAMVCMVGCAMEPAKPMAPMSEKEMMEKMAKVAAVGKQHEGFKPMVGTFKADSKMWMAPGAEPTANSGTMTSTLLMGGRYLKGDFSGDMMGQPMTGMSLLAYDNNTEKYVNTWCDSMSTGIMYSESAAGASGKVIELKGEMKDCMTGDLSKFRETFEVLSDDKHEMKMYCNAPDGKEYLCMDIVYTRVK